MVLFPFLIRAVIYIMSLFVSFYALQALDFQKLLKANRVSEARVLYALLVIALAYLVGSFIIQFLYTL